MHITDLARCKKKSETTDLRHGEVIIRTMSK